jgi:outer membrane murein-binding lipoprotein Lpp
MPAGAFWAWNFALAAYTSLMIGGAGYAYRCQPDEQPANDAHDLRARLQQAAQTVAAMRAELETARAVASEVPQLRAQIAELGGQVEQARAAVDSVREWAALTAQSKARLIAACSNGDRPPAGELAGVLGVSASTIRRGYSEADRENN